MIKAGIDFLHPSAAEIEIYFQLGYTPSRLYDQVINTGSASQMLNSFIIVLREGFESLLLVAIILSFLRKTGQKWLTTSVYVAIAIGLATSVALGYVLKTGVDDAVLISALGTTLGGYAGTFFNNEALREGILGVAAILMVGSLVVYMWRTGPKVQQRMRDRLSELSSRKSRLAAVAGVFLFTFLMITREGMETALLLLQVRDGQIVTGAILGLVAAGIFALAWARYGHLINIKRFFQVTGVFLLLFIIQVAIYTFHEFAEAGLLPNSELLHEATEKFSPDGLYGKWFSVLMVSVCGVWLAIGWLMDRLKPESRTTPPLGPGLIEPGAS